MPALSSALAFKRLMESDSALSMLRADNLPIMATILGTHLGKPGAVMPTDELHERIESDLEELRDYFDTGDKRGKAFCDDWRRKGILVRRPATAVRGEIYELSAAGFDAIRILDQLRTPPQTTTQSRLRSLSQAVHNLALETDPDQSRRLAQLEAEKRRIDRQIELIQQGNGDEAMLDDRMARERVSDILQQAAGLPGDFARVRARFEELNHELRVSILESDESQARVLDEIFRGVDLIASSDEGRTFAAFAKLLREPEHAASFDEDISRILDRDFAEQLNRDERQALRLLMRHMKTGARDVQQTLSEFARGLRNYVFSREFQTDRVLLALTREAMSQAASITDVCKPTTDIGITLELPSVRMTSVGNIQLHDPDEYITGDELGIAEAAEVDYRALVALARESEIDIVELVGNVNAAVEESGPVTVAEVLAQFPATQGVASVVGLVSLAVNHGECVPGESDTLEWVGLDDVARAATVARWRFTERIRA
ncbi:DUF3375 domain-containing protein [uncultured Brevibacterium sp.]|uniref:DUF3375 domain-containing protein n=1 Tax=uncultured Brevibacterium sp. TaxID=189678 RepID=UPI0025E493AA|nr:DUF3375 domain-containing protein [uncultured Brevibacterium sp.]